MFRINFNELLAEPIFRGVATYWEKTLVSLLQKDINTMGEARYDALRPALTHAPPPPPLPRPVHCSLG